MEHICGLTDFLDEPRKWSQEANNFDVFYVQYIHRDKWFRIEKVVLSHVVRIQPTYLKLSLD